MFTPMVISGEAELSSISLWSINMTVDLFSIILVPVLIDQSVLLPRTSDSLRVTINNVLIMSTRKKQTLSN